VIFASITADRAAGHERTVILGHRQEIADQISLALSNLGVAHGLIRPDAAMTSDPVRVAMAQTLVRRLDAVPEPHLLIIDEAHHAVASTWVRIAAAWPNARVLGVTATPERLDGRGLCDAFDTMVVGPDTAQLIAQGWLAPVRYLAPETGLDLSTVRTLGGDYSTADLAGVVDRDTVTGNVVEHYLHHLGGRTAIAFTCTVAHANHVALRFRNAGIPAESIDGSMTPAERRAVVGRLRTGAIRVLTSCEVISEGFDAPAVGGCILLRPTQSLALFLQQVGRCLRPKANGAEATVLDHVGNVFRHGLPTAPHAWSLFSARRAAADRNNAVTEASRLKRCAACGMVFVSTARSEFCGVDGCLFAPRRFIERPGMLREMPAVPLQAPVWTSVHTMAGSVHLKPGSPPSFRMTFGTELGPVHDFMALAHPSAGARWHAERKWQLLSRSRNAVPRTAAEAEQRFAAGELRRPLRVLVARDGAWWRVTDAEFGA
jgi:superfamily II DNA or RNA helicase